MTLGFLFWLLIILLLLFGFVPHFPGTPENFRSYGLFGGSILTFLLIVLLGIKVFGWPIQGG